MRMTRLLTLAIALASIFTTLGSAPPSKTTLKSPFGSPYDSGVLTLDFAHIDDLLSISRVSELRIVEVTRNSAAEVSSAHLALLLRWVEGGGVVWFREEGTASALFGKVNPGVTVGRREFWKESGAGFGAGELFVKGLLPQLVIGDHAVTEGVSSLYVLPYNWGGTRHLEIKGAAYTPIISFKSVADGLHTSPPDGKLYVLLALVERGDGLVLIDVTRLGSKVWKGPNGNEYDGPTFYRNIKAFHNRSRSERPAI
jgi:hypothetical protein